jgi:hypothetical protein
VVVGALPTGNLTSRDGKPSESGVVHDHIRLCQHQIVGCSSCGGEFSPVRGSAEMISDGRSDANRKVLVKSIGEHLLPTA